MPLATRITPWKERVRVHDEERRDLAGAAETARKIAAKAAHPHGREDSDQMMAAKASS